MKRSMKVRRSYRTIIEYLPEAKMHLIVILAVFGLVSS